MYPLLSAALGDRSCHPARLKSVSWALARRPDFQLGESLVVGWRIQWAAGAMQNRITQGCGLSFSRCIFLYAMELDNGRMGVVG